MASKKKSSTKKKTEVTVNVEIPAVIDQEEVIIAEPEEPAVIEPEEEEVKVEPEEEVKVEPKVKKKSEESKNAPKFKIGDIVYITRNTEADLRGVGLFPQHKKYTYTVEDYNPLTDTYTIRRLNAVLYLRGDHLLSPDEKAHDSLHKAQY